MNIKDQIEDLLLSVEDDFTEDQLIKLLEDYGPFDDSWSLENMYLPRLDTMRASGNEWRN